MTKAYETTPGTMPHRAVEFLCKNNATCLGKEVPTAVICDFLDTDVNTFAASLKPAREHGLVRARRIAGKGPTLWWCLGKGEPDLPEDHEPDAPLSTGGLAPAPVRPRPLFPPAVAGSSLVEEPTVAVDAGRVPFTPWTMPTQPGDYSNEAPAAPDALLSCRTGVITLVGLKVDARGRVEVPAELVACIKRYIAWGPAT